MNQHKPRVHALSRTHRSMSIRHPSGKRSPVTRKQGFASGHHYRGGWPPRCYGIRVSRQIDTPRRHVWGPTSGGPHGGRQCGSKRISCFHFRGAQAQPLRSSGTGVLRRAQLQTRHPRGESFGRLGKEGSDLIDQVAASIVGGTDALSRARKGGCKERVPIPSHLCDHPGRNFAQSSSI